MAPRKNTTPKKGKLDSDKPAANESINGLPDSQKKPASKPNNDNVLPVLVVFQDKSSTIYHGGKENAKTKFGTSVADIFEGTLEDLQKLQEFTKKMQNPIHGLTYEEVYYAQELKPRPALVKFSDGSAFAHYLGVDFMREKLKTLYKDEDYEKLEFEEDDDFDRIEKLATAYNQVASVRCKSPDEIEAVDAAPQVFRKLVPTSTDM